MPSATGSKKKRTSAATCATVSAATCATVSAATCATTSAIEVQPLTEESNPLPSPEENTKKRAKKTRTSKIVTKQQIVSSTTVPSIANIILNLKCSMCDLKDYNDRLSKMISNPLEYNSSAPPEVKYYDGEKTFGTFIRTDSPNEKPVSNFISFATETGTDNSNDMSTSKQTNNHIATIQKNGSIGKSTIAGETSLDFITDNELSTDKKKYSTKQIFVSNTDQDDFDDVNIKDMSAKIKQLKIQLYKNTLHSEKKSACFWCTYDFDNAPCYIPKYEMDGTIYGYGSFCRPECAVAYLMKESIDDSTKFDRYHLLNQIYSKVYDCKKNIKPSPDPHYLLDKFYGNLNIQEYRRLLKTEHLLLVIDKPLTRILPELHEDTDDAFTKIYGIKATSGNSSGVYKVKRQSEQPQGPSKASIIKTTFGITQ